MTRPPASCPPGIYSVLVEAMFGAEVPPQLEHTTFDCVLMIGGFAAGHLPLSSLATMAKLCKPGGLVVNMMTLEYVHLVEEYRGLEEYVKRLEEEGVWRLEERAEVDSYNAAGKLGLRHIFRRC